MTALKIQNIQVEPLDFLSYQTIATGKMTAENFALPIYQGEIAGLPQNIDAIIVTSDLQGVCHVKNQPSRLLGEVLADSLALIYEMYCPDLQLAKSWAILCGDLYANLEQRGSGGNPLQVWQAFASQCQQVIGIAGNHDHFGEDLSTLKKIQNVHFLEHDVCVLAGVKIAGLSGIIGRSDKNFRLSEQDYIQKLRQLVKQQPDILLTHLSPHLADEGFLGEPKLTAQLAQLHAHGMLWCCGHSHWNTHQVVNWDVSTQILNADSRVFILRRAEKAVQHF